MSFARRAELQIANDVAGFTSDGRGDPTPARVAAIFHGELGEEGSRVQVDQLLKRIGPFRRFAAAAKSFTLPSDIRRLVRS